MDERRLEGLLLPILSSIEALAPHAWGQAERNVIVIRHLLVGMWALLLRLDTLPELAALRQQQRALAMSACMAWGTLAGTADIRSISKAIKSLDFLSSVFIPQEQRAIVCMVEFGPLSEIAFTAQAVLPSRGSNRQQVVALLVGLWSLVTNIGDRPVQQLGQGQEPPPSWQLWSRCYAQIEALPAQQRQRLLTRRQFWEGEAAQMLRTARALDAAIPPPRLGDREMQLRAAAALATRPCANPRCTNMRGSSEGRLRGRRCGGCGTARFCSRECQVVAWEEHRAVCGPGGSQA